jgi:ribosomal protein L37AE/L43A
MSDGCQNYDKGQQPPRTEQHSSGSLERVVRRKKDGVKPTDARPCPFCGETPQVIRESELNWIAGKYDQFFIRCKKTKCLVKPTVNKRTLREVMEAWNTRNPFA